MEVLLAKKWDPSIDPTGWWMSEKLDGVRAYWTGEKLLTRNGNEIHAPDWFVKLLPAYDLDGELWAGRGRFQQAVSTVRKLKPVDNEWKNICFQVFDAPFEGVPFEDRQFRVRARAHHGSVRDVPQERCEGFDHLKAQLAAVNTRGGEGLMLRKPGSLYERKRSDTLLKVKTFHDAEAWIVSHLPGEGKHKGRLGALECITTDGKHFAIGTGFSDAQREDPPAVGTLVTYRYQELTDAGVPRFPSFVRTAVLDTHLPHCRKTGRSDLLSPPTVKLTWECVPGCPIAERARE